MARVKKDVEKVEKTGLTGIKEESEKVEKTGLTGIKEESEKGEMFFRIVLVLMAVAFLGLITYFIIDAIIGNKNSGNETMYHENNYVTLTDVERIVNGENFENIANEGLKDALDNLIGGKVYILFFNENDMNSLSSLTKERQDKVLLIVDQLMDDAKEVTLTVDGEDYIYYQLDDDNALFFLDVSKTEGWQDVIDTSAGQANSKNIPALLEIDNGEDLNWFGPIKSAGQNVSAETKLDELLND